MSAGARAAELWTFAVTTYARPGVKEACLALQDDHGADVDVLLWALWRAVRGVPTSDEDLDRAHAAVAGVQAQIIRPLRAIRRTLSDAAFGPETARSALDAARAKVLAAELEGERAALAILADLDPPPTSQGGDAAGQGGWGRPDRDAAAAALDRVATRLGAPSDARAPFAALARLALPYEADGLLYTSEGDSHPLPLASRWTAMDSPPIDALALRERLASLRDEHRALDAAADALQATGVSDQLKIARIKKRKLALKDEISWIEDQLNPDIIA